MRPNILLVFPDQWRADWTAMNKLVPVRTPNLTRLAENGVWFSSAITPSPLCAPARAALASGMEYWRCGVPTGGHDYPVGQATFYRLLRDAGYHVMGCGKFDLAKAAFGWKTDGSSRIAEWGFSEGIDSEGKWDAISSGRNEPRGPYMAFLEQRGLRKVHVEDMSSRRSIFDAFPTPLPDDAYGDNWIASNALRLIASAPAEKPWFLQVNFAGPHEPWDITAAMADLYRDADFPLPRNSKSGHAESHLAVRRNYAAMLENIDRWLGSFLDILRETGQGSNTVVFVSADHGEMLGDRDLWAKSVPFQPSISVPLAVSGPGVRKGAIITAPTTTLDLGGTFLDYAGVRIPAGWDTRSLRGLLESPERPPVRRFVVSALPNWRLVFDGRFKLVQYHDRTELFDTVEDVAEENDMSSTESTRVEIMKTAAAQIFHRKRMIFIGGSEGSGTTLLLRVLSAPDICTSLGGNYIKLPGHPDAGPLAKAFNDSNARLWDRKLPLAEHSAARREWSKAARAIIESDAYADRSVLVYKRSFPFGLERDRHTPDIWHAVDLLDDTRIVVIYRDPCAATYSALRRGFDTDLRRIALACSEQLTWLAGQVRAIGREAARVIRYSDLCRDPAATLRPIANFCGIPFDEVRDSLKHERIGPEADERYVRELERSDVEWLEGFFDVRRRRQWDILEAGFPTDRSRND